MSSKKKLPNVFETCTNFLYNILQKIFNNKAISGIEQHNWSFKKQQNPTSRKAIDWNSVEGKEEKKLLLNLLKLNKAAYDYDIKTTTSETQKIIAERSNCDEFAKHHYDSNTNYLGIGVINSETKKVFVAHRATKLDGALTNIKKGNKYDKLTHVLQTDIKDDFQLFLKQDISARIEQAQKFIQDLESKYKGYEIIQTGFSLGGAIAQAIYKTKDIESYVFDAPGYCSEPVTEAREKSINYYDRVPNFLNSCNPKLEAKNKVHYIIPNAPLPPEANTTERYLPINCEDFIKKGLKEHIITATYSNLEQTTPILTNDFPTTVFDAHYQLMQNREFWQDYLRSYAKELHLDNNMQEIVIDYIQKHHIKKYPNLWAAITNLTTPKKINVYETIYTALKEEQNSPHVLASMPSEKTIVKAKLPVMQKSKTDDDLPSKPKISLFEELLPIQNSGEIKLSNIIDDTSSG
jgi:hypothetical protein